MRATLQKLLDLRDRKRIKEACTIAEEYIKDLESALISGKSLHETYRFDPALVDRAAYFSPEEEFARSTVFVELAQISHSLPHLTQSVETDILHHCQ